MESKSRFTMSDTWSPTVGLDCVRFALTIAALNKCYVSTYDVSGAYLYGSRTEDDDIVYLRLPPGVSHLNDLLSERGLPPRKEFKERDENGNTVIYRVTKNLYGMQDAGAVWYLYARTWLLGPRMQMTQSVVDPCLFFRFFEDGSYIILLLYVDDSLQIMSNDAVQKWFTEEFHLKFRQSPGSGQNGLEHEFLGVRIRQSQDRGIIQLNTKKLWLKLEHKLKDVKLPNPRAPLPMNAMEEINAEEQEDENPIMTVEECDARGLLGLAAWGVQATRPGEVHAAAVLARRVHIPTRRYCKMLLYFCAYLISRKEDEVIIGAASRERSFHTHVDSSWANDPETSRSWFGYSLRWGGAAFAFRSKLEPVVALSSRDAECIACVFCVKAVVGFAILMRELRMLPKDTFQICVDNKATVQGAHTDKVTKDSRHQSMRLAWLREAVRTQVVRLVHVTTGLNEADIQTKILTGPAHGRIRAVLMGHTAEMSVESKAELSNYEKTSPT